MPMQPTPILQGLSRCLDTLLKYKVVSLAASKMSTLLFVLWNAYHILNKLQQLWLSGYSSWLHQCVHELFLNCVNEKGLNAAYSTSAFAFASFLALPLAFFFDTIAFICKGSSLPHWWELDNIIDSDKWQGEGQTSSQSIDSMIEITWSYLRTLTNQLKPVRERDVRLWGTVKYLWK